MRKIFGAICLATTLLASLSAQADTAALSTCLTGNLDDNERKSLAVWVFQAIALHPEIRQYANVTKADANSTDRIIGALITRLLTEDCPEELEVATRADPRAIQRSFEVVGAVAMQELMNNTDVNVALSNFTEYADMEKINAIISTRQ